LSVVRGDERCRGVGVCGGVLVDAGAWLGSVLCLNAGTGSQSRGRQRTKTGETRRRRILIERLREHGQTLPRRPQILVTVESPGATSHPASTARNMASRQGGILASLSACCGGECRATPSRANGFDQGDERWTRAKRRPREGVRPEHRRGEPPVYCAAMRMLRIFSGR